MSGIRTSIDLIKLRPRISRIAERFKIKSMQNLLRKETTVLEILQKMRDNKFDVIEDAIGGYKYQGIYYINEGNHRMTAAILYYIEKGDKKYINSFLEGKYSNWDPRKPQRKTYDFPIKY